MKTIDVADEDTQYFKEMTIKMMAEWIHTDYLRIAKYILAQLESRESADDTPAQRLRDSWSEYVKGQQR